MYILDTSAWIEFFLKTDRGNKVGDYLKICNCFTSIITLSEIINWARKNNQQGIKLLRYIQYLSTIINLDDKISQIAGELNFAKKKLGKKWGMIDSIIYSTALLYGLRTISKDLEFRNLPNVEIL